MKDTLFLLAPGFLDGDGPPYYCPHCTIFEGLLSLFPQLNAQLEVKRIAFSRPRTELVHLLGENHQSCPVLVLAAPLGSPIEGVRVNEANGRWFIDEPEDIGNYLSATCGIPRPH